MNYRIRGFGAFSVDDQKAVCLANEPSGAYWNNEFQICSNLTQDGSRMMCEASGGTWDVAAGCRCPPSGDPNINANFIGCQSGQSRLKISQAGLRMAVATKKTPAVQLPPPPGGAPVPPAELSSWPSWWPYALGAGVLVIGVGAYMALGR